MGHREKLLAGAKQCLYERGYAHTTARDIVAASGTNLASIGYHFDSKEALLNEAMMAASGEMADELVAGMQNSADRTGNLAERFSAFLTGLTGSFDKHRPTWVATFEALAQAERFPELREQIAAGHDEGRRGLTAELLGVAESALDERTVRTVGSLLIAILTGVADQHLLDPQRAPTAEEILEGLRAVTAPVQHPGTDERPEGR